MEPVEYVPKTDRAAIVRLAEGLADLTARVTEAPHPPVPDDEGTEPVVQIPVGAGAVEIHEVLDDDLPTVHRHLARTCYVVQTYSDGALTSQVLTFSPEDTITVARAFTARLTKSDDLA